MYEFLSGAIATATFIVGLFFLRFYKKIDDRFFLYLAIAFWIFSLERFILVFTQVSGEYYSMIYLIRLSGFIIITFAIVDKNRRP
ncbi:MAG: DUF5985 family protein [Bdellovibrionota bacterium]